MKISRLWASIRRHLRWETIHDLAECALSLAEGELAPADLILYLSQLGAEAWEVFRQGDARLSMPNVRATAGANLHQSKGLQQTDGRRCRVTGNSVFGLKLPDRLELGAWWIDTLLDLALQIVGNPAAPA